MMNVYQIKQKTYTAKPTKFSASGFGITIAGTLDGYIDLAITQSDGESLTYNMSCDDIRLLVAGLNTTIEDIRKNCLYDKDALLKK